MELRQLTERVFYTMFSKESDRSVLGYINGQKCSLMVDSGNSKNHVELFNEAVGNEGLRKPERIVITHWHWDHTFWMHVVEGITIAHKRTNDKLVNTYGIITKQAGYMDEIALGQYHALVQYLIRISNPKLSIKEVNELIDSGVDLNELKGKRGFYYQLKVGQDPVNTVSFTIVSKGGW